MNGTSAIIMGFGKKIPVPESVTPDSICLPSRPLKNRQASVTKNLIKYYKMILTAQLLSICFFFLINLFIYLLAGLGLRCCRQAFSSCIEQGLLFITVRGLLIEVTSLCCRARALGARASVAVARRVSCSTACGIFPDQGSNPCPLHWQADS